MNNQTLRRLDHAAFLRLAPVVIACDGDATKERAVLQGDKYNWIDWRLREHYLREMHHNEEITRGVPNDE